MGKSILDSEDSRCKGPEEAVTPGMLGEWRDERDGWRGEADGQPEHGRSDGTQTAPCCLPGAQAEARVNC